jgi:hypothetical protein
MLQTRGVQRETRNAHFIAGSQEKCLRDINSERKIILKLIFFPEDGVGLVPKRGCLLTLAYYAFPR